MRPIIAGIVLVAALALTLLLGRLNAAQLRPAAPGAASVPAPLELPPTPADNASTSGAPAPAQVFIADYGYVSQADMIAHADAIVLGTVTAISPAQWNTADGAYTTAGDATNLPYHTVTISVTRTLFSTFALDPALEVTVLGASPAGSSAVAGVKVLGQVDHSLHVGDTGVFFAGRTRIAWHASPESNETTRAALVFEGRPAYSYLRRRANGLYYSEDPETPPITLDDLTRQIQERRGG